MTRLFLAGAALLALSELAPARAQFGFGPVVPYYGYGSRYSYSYRSGFGFTAGGPHFRVSGFSGGFVTRSVYYPPPIIGFAPVVPAGFGPPVFGGWGPGFGPPVVAVPVPVPVPVVVAPPEPEPPPFAPPVLFPKGAKESDFIVIAPKKDDPIPLPLPLPPAKVPPIPFDPFKPPAPVKAEAADADPKKEAARLVNLGKAAFAAGDYGRAAEHFERAATADPAGALAPFLHAQAKFAAGQFGDAVARVREGLALDPKWPLAPFNPVELYGDRPERFVVHLMALKKAVADNPNQAPLEFLLGYQLWYSGEKGAADKLFRAAEMRLPAPGPIALFKLP